MRIPETKLTLNTATADVAETKSDEPVEAAAAVDEKPKPTKRNSIFDSFKAGFKSPVKEKEQNDAELKSETANETAVSSTAPQLWEPAPDTTTTTGTTSAIAEPKIEGDKVAAGETVPSPNREKKNFLSGLPFLNKRDRSVSPSAASKEVTEISEPAPVTPTVAATETGEKSEEKTTSEEPTANGNKRQSVLGGLGRRASKMLSRGQPHRKENVAPTAAATTATTTETEAEESAVTEINPAVVHPAAAQAITASAITEDKPAPIATTGSSAVAASA